MKIIKCIADKISEEIEDANAYIDLATEWKEKEPEAAKVFYELSTEEVKHADMLHEVVTKMINEYRETHGEPPEPMLFVYDYLHGKQIENSMRVKVKQKMYDETA